MISYIYFIQAGNNGPIKIGYSAKKYIKDRLITLQTGNHEKLVLLCTIPGTKNTEKELHKKFKEFWIRGEWFHVNTVLSELISSLPYLGITSEWDNKGPNHVRWIQDASDHLKQDRVRRKFTLGTCINCGRPGNDYYFKDGNNDNLSSDNITYRCRRCTMQADGRLENLKQASKKSAQIRKEKRKTHCDNCDIKCDQIRRGRCKNCYRYFIENDIERPIENLDENKLLKRGPKPKAPQNCINCNKLEIIRIKSGKCHACYEFFRRNGVNRQLIVK